MPAYICFIDLTKAFDRVRLGDILNILIENKTPTSITKIDHNLNNNNVTKVIAGHQFTENIPTHREELDKATVQAPSCLTYSWAKL